MTEPFLVCDFCLEPDPPWEYPARESPLVGGLVDSIGSWCACEACRTMIDENDVDGLAAHAYDRNTDKGVSLGVIKMIQSEFFKARTGPARPTKVTPIHGRIFER